MKTVAVRDEMDGVRKRKGYVMGHDWKTQIELQFMIWPAIILIIIFNFVPLYGLLIAFENYDPFSGAQGIFHSPWNNFQNFTALFDNFQFWPMLRNTIAINLLGSFLGLPITLAFALLLNEIISIRFKSLIQTVTYLPHFLSWVIYGGLFITLLSPEGGVVNFLLLKFHFIDKPILFLGDPKYFWGIAVGTAILKDLGWGAILYLAAIAGVDQSLYEAASIDGAGRFKKMWHITIPGIMPTVMILVIFALSGMVNNNFDRVYVFQNSLNLDTSQVISTYLYRVGLQQFQFGMATATGLLNSVITLLLLLGANLASNKLTKTGLF